MIELTPSTSPLARTRAKASVKLGRSRRRLSSQDQETVKLILDEKYDVIPHPDYELPVDEAMRLIFEEAIEIPVPDTTWYSPVMDRNWDENRHGAYRNDGSIVLTAKQEQALFKKFNYCRHHVNLLKDQILEERDATGEVDPQLADEMLDWHVKAEAYRIQIADTNLALVLAMAKRSRMTDADFTEMVSEGNMALLRAVDKFDANRGFKFSTYACRAILKAFSRQGIKNARYRQLFPTDFDPTLERSNWDQTRRDDHEKDCVDELKSIINANRADLSDIEHEVIKHRFALDRPSDDDHRPLTLEQVGKLIGVTKERVRQIQNRALVKLKQQLEDDFLV